MLGAWDIRTDGSTSHADQSITNARREVLTDYQHRDTFYQNALVVCTPRNQGGTRDHGISEDFKGAVDSDQPIPQEHDETRGKRHTM